MSLRTTLPVFLFLALLAASAAQAAGDTHLLRGKVSDAKSGQPLPSANIQVLGTVTGTITNSDGSFQLAISPPIRLRISYIGYNSQTFTLDSLSETELEIRLVPAVIDFGQVTITAKNPALNIMEKVLSHKQAMREKIRSFSAQAYHRLNVQNDTSVVMIIENVSRLYWQAGRGSREVFGEIKQTANLPTLQQGIGVSDIPNFYDDDILIGGYTFVGPTHPKIFDYYAFSLTGRHAMDGRIIYEIHLTPKGRLQPLFEGDISIQDSSFALIAVDLAGTGMTRQSVLQKYEVNLQQQFRELSPGIWLPADWHEKGTLRVGMTGLQFPSIHYLRLASLDDYQLNIPVPDSLFRLERFRAPRDSTLVFKEGGVPLSFEEKWAYDTIDSSMTLLQAFRPTGFLAKMAKLDVRANDQSLTQADSTSGKGGKEKKRRTGGKWRLEQQPMVWFNRVEELHLGWNSRLRGGAWALQAGAAWRTGPKSWAWQAGLAHSRNWGGLELAYTDETRPIDAVVSYPLLANSGPQLLGYRDYYDYYNARGWRTTLSLKNRRHHLAGKLSLLREEQASVEKTTDFDLVPGDAIRRTNPAISDGTLTALAVRLDWGMADNDLFGGATGIRWEYERGLRDFLGGGFDYDLVRLTASWRIHTFLRRQPLPASLDLHLIAAAAAGDLPPQRTSGLPGSLGAWTPFGTFHTVRGGTILAEKYAGLLWEHNFRAWPLDRLGWHWPGEQGLNLLLHGAHGRTWRKLAASEGPDIHELGISLSGLFTYARIDLTRRLGMPDFWCVGLSVSKFF
jgi:hypothetical protein